MRIKLDENLPAAAAGALRSLSHDVHTTADEGLAGGSDEHIWAAAQRENRFLITQDLDFSDLRAFSPGTHHGILLIRLRDPNRIDLTRRLETLFRTEPVDTWADCVVVATDTRVRIARRGK